MQYSTLSNNLALTKHSKRQIAQSSWALLWSWLRGDTLSWWVQILMKRLSASYTLKLCRTLIFFKCCPMSSRWINSHLNLSTKISRVRMVNKCQRVYFWSSTRSKSSVSCVSMVRSASSYVHRCSWTMLMTSECLPTFWQCSRTTRCSSKIPAHLTRGKLMLFSSCYVPS